ncbi:MAG: hypothetical protein HC846_04560, partial [Blastocatellia bacterium]|nr:hypothetical protein [Blastocatellia bacterium]
DGDDGITNCGKRAKLHPSLPNVNSSDAGDFTKPTATLRFNALFGWLRK